MTRGIQVSGAILAIGLLAGSLAGPAIATVQNDDVMCWYPDVESPAGCDDDD